MFPSPAALVASFSGLPPFWGLIRCKKAPNTFAGGLTLNGMSVIATFVTGMSSKVFTMDSWVSQQAANSLTISALATQPVPLKTHGAFTLVLGSVMGKKHPGWRDPCSLTATPWEASGSNGGSHVAPLTRGLNGVGFSVRWSKTSFLSLRCARAWLRTSISPSLLPHKKNGQLRPRTNSVPWLPATGFAEGVNKQAPSPRVVVQAGSTAQTG